MRSTMEKKLLMTSDLKARGWTLAIIRKFLPDPDDTKENPVFSSKAPMKLYAANRVADIELTAEFKWEQAKVPERRKTALKAVATKRLRMQEYIDNVIVELPKLTLDEAQQKAITHYNTRGPRRWDVDTSWSPASVHSDLEFLDRITVNYLRHCCTKYESHLRRIAGKTGAKDGYTTMKKKVLDSIASAFPDLAEECGAQKDMMDSVSDLA
jgi:hypothetical protein